MPRRDDGKEQGGNQYRHRPPDRQRWLMPRLVARICGGQSLTPGTFQRGETTVLISRIPRCGQESPSGAYRSQMVLTVTSYSDLTTRCHRHRPSVRRVPRLRHLDGMGREFPDRGGVGAQCPVPADTDQDRRSVAPASPSSGRHSRPRLAAPVARSATAVVPRPRYNSWCRYPGGQPRCRSV